MLARSVLVADIVVGAVVDLVLDRNVRRVLGFEVRCGDEEHRFLPFGAATATEAAVDARSPLALLDQPELAFYCANGSSLRTLRGTLARRTGNGAARPVEDLELSTEGDVTGVLLGSKDLEHVARVGVTLEVPIPPAPSV